MTSKAIAIELRASINTEVELAEAYEASENKYWEASFGATDKAEADKFFHEAEAAEAKARKHKNNVRHLRAALHHILDTMGVECDSFHPETAEF